MKISEKLLNELQNRLKDGGRRGVHLNAIPIRSRYKFGLLGLSYQFTLLKHVIEKINDTIKVGNLDNYVEILEIVN